MSTVPQALIITVNFRQPDCTLAFLRSVAQLEESSRCHCIVVDNNSGDASTARIESEIGQFRNAELLASQENRGYFGAAKWALDRHQRAHGLPDWTIVCNNDIVFDRRDFMTELFAREPQSAGVFAPTVISQRSGLDSNPMIARRPGPLRILRYRFLLSNYHVACLVQKMSPFVRRHRDQLRGLWSRARHGPKQIYAPHGSIFVFSRSFFECGGYLDEGSFLFGEELAVAETCVRIGLPIIHEPRLHVVHKDSQTTGTVLTREMYRYQKRGLQYAISRYLDPRGDEGLSTPASTRSLVDSTKQL